MVIARIVWLVVGIICVGLAFIGALLPIMPTTVFLLMAAYAFARSSPTLHAWLLSHKNFGPLVKNWQDSGSIAKSTKIIAVSVMFGTLIISWLIGFSTLVIIIQGITLGIVALFILTRPLPIEK